VRLIQTLQAPGWKSILGSQLGFDPGRMSGMDDLITAQEAAELLHMHVKRVQQLARDGKLPAVRYGRKWLFRRRDLTGARRRGARSTELELSSGIEISARNQLRGTIVEIRADGVMAEVVIRIGDQDLVAIITRSSAERLGLAKGDEVLAVIKSTEVMVAKETSGR
jgi:molybdopterin-binding protein